MSTREVLRAVALAALLAMGVAGSVDLASAHPQTPRVLREIVRLQGYLGDPPPGVASSGEMTLVVFSERHRLRVTDWQVFGTSDVAPSEECPSELRLQGDRAQLAGIASLAGRRITLLGERRPGSGEVFLLALDVCPPVAAAP
jgi:hypothetical protein